MKRSFGLFVKYRHALLGLSLPWATAGSAFRFPVGFGVGEIGLLVWSIGVILAVSRSRVWINSNSIFLMSLFVIMMVAMLVGWSVSSYLTYWSSNATRDMAAYFFIFVMVFAAAQDQVQSRGGEFNGVVKWYLVGVAVYISLFGVAILGGADITEMWYRPKVEERWQGFATNPNQVALMLLPVPILAIYWWDSVKMGLWGVLPVYFVGVFLGMMSRSDALLVAWLALGVTMFFMFILNKIKMRRGSALMIVFLVMSSAYMLSNKIPYMNMDGVEVGYDGEGGVFFSQKGKDGKAVGGGEISISDRTQVAVRLKLWKNALMAWWRSPLVGLGPGAHSGFNGPFEGVEAHNVILDLMTQAGLLGVAAFVAWWLYLVVKGWERKAYYSVGLIVCIMVFGMFHNVLRHPIFWVFPLILFSFEACGEKKVAREQVSS